MEARKTPQADLEKKSFLFFTIGLMIAMVMVITAFEWKSYGPGIVIEPEDFDNTYLVPLVPLTAHPVPQPPKAVIDMEKDPIEDKKLVEEAIEKIVVSVEKPASSMDFSEDLTSDIAPDVTPDNAPFKVVEEMPVPTEGMTEFLKTIGKNVKYPYRAQRAGTEGIVYIQFVVERNGSLTDIEVLKGIGSGCDEAAVEAVKKSKKWKPGKQRGIPVRVHMVIPVRFNLQ